MSKKGYPDGIIRYPISVTDHTPAKGGGSVSPNSVGTDEIIDGSVQRQDLSETVRSKLNEGFATSEDIAEMFRKS